MDSLLHELMNASAGAAGSLVSAVWEGLVLAACVALCLKVLPGVSAAVRSAVWMAVLVVVAGLPLLPRSGAAVSEGSRGFHVSVVWSVVLVAVWALLTLVRAGQLVWSAVHLRGVARRAVPVAVDAAVLRLLEGNGRRAELCVSDEVDRPSVVGFFAPRILLPPDVLAKMESAELAQIVLHEMEHLRRGDDWTNLIQKVCLTLFPLNPVLLWIERRLCVERELACDDGVLRSTGAAKAYASCLANLAEHRLVRRGVSLALGAWERQSELAKRVHRILDRREVPMTRTRMAMTLGCLLSGVAAGGVGLAHSPRLVSFVAEAPVQMANAPVEAMPVARGFDHAAGHVTMAKAVMPARANSNGNDVSRELRVESLNVRSLSASAPAFAGSPRQQKVAAKRRAQPVRPARQGWFVLTAWQQVEVVPDLGPRVVQTVQTEDAPRQVRMVADFPVDLPADVPVVRTQQFSYAIATREGWLVFQL